MPEADIMKVAIMPLYVTSS